MNVLPVDAAGISQRKRINYTEEAAFQANWICVLESESNFKECRS